jgi:hypothetical protein
MLSRSSGIAKTELHAGPETANIAEGKVVQRGDLYLVIILKILGKWPILLVSHFVVANVVDLEKAR